MIVPDRHGRIRARAERGAVRRREVGARHHEPGRDDRETVGGPCEAEDNLVTQAQRECAQLGQESRLEHQARRNVSAEGEGGCTRRREAQTRHDDDGPGAMDRHSGGALTASCGAHGSVLGARRMPSLRLAVGRDLDHLSKVTALTFQRRGRIARHAKDAPSAAPPSLCGPTSQPRHPQCIAVGKHGYSVARAGCRAWRKPPRSRSMAR